jgi:hypothetical protein
MRATLTKDLFDRRPSTLKIVTCAEMLNHMPEIFYFISSKGIRAKLTSDFNTATITMRGPTLEEYLGDIQQFIESRGWEK